MNINLNTLAGSLLVLPEYLFKHLLYSSRQRLKGWSVDMSVSELSVLGRRRGANVSSFLAQLVYACNT